MRGVRSLALLALGLLACPEEARQGPFVARQRTTDLPLFAPPKGFERLTLGVAPYAPREEVALAHGKLADHLGRVLQVPVEVRVGDDYLDVVKRFGSGEYDLVSLSPFTYVVARRQVPMVCVAQTISDGSATAAGYLYVRDDSPLQSVQELKGARFGFVDRLSTSGYLYPMKLLREAGFTDADLRQQEFLGNHEAVLRAVKEGRVDVGASYQSALQALRRTGGVDPLGFRVVGKTERTPRDVLCLRREVPGEVVAAVRHALLALTGRERAGREILGPLDINGFQEPDLEAYARVAEAARKLGWLE